MKKAKLECFRLMPMMDRWRLPLLELLTEPKTFQIIKWSHKNLPCACLAILQKKTKKNSFFTFPSYTSWCHVNSVIDNPQIFSLNKTSFDNPAEHHGLVFRHLNKKSWTIFYLLFIFNRQFLHSLFIKKKKPTKNKKTKHIK